MYAETYSQAEQVQQQAPRRAPQQPMLRAYSVTGRPGGGSTWTEIGAAFMHRDGRGYNVPTELLPVNGRMVLRAPKGTDISMLNGNKMYAYTILSRGENGFWRCIGEVEHHKDGRGLTVDVHALPRDGVFVLREPAEPLDRAA